MKPQPPSAAPAPDGRPSAGLPPRIDSGRLFGSARELHIEHRGELYRLRQTAQGKLILTK